MKNKTKNIICGPSHFNVFRVAKEKSVTLVQKAVELSESLAPTHNGKLTFRKISFFKPPLREPSIQNEEVRQLSRCRPEGYKIRVLILLMFIFPMLAFQPERTGALVGTVFSEDRRPVSDVMIVIESSKYITSTNSEGFFVIDPIEEGEYTALVIGAEMTEQRHLVLICRNRLTVLEIEADQFSIND